MPGPFITLFLIRNYPTIFVRNSCLSMNLEKICRQSLEIVRHTGDFIAGERMKLTMDQVERKGKHNFVTYVDKRAEELLVDGLHKIVPEAGFITEEETNVVQKEEFNWVIDPLDGTTNYIHGSPPYAVSVALMKEKSVILGIVYEIVSSEMFCSFLGSDALLDGKRIHVSATDSVSEALIATGFPYTRFARLEPFMRSLSHLFLHSHGVRRMGSAATDLAYVACGRYDAFYEFNLNPWDVAAGSFIVQQAGGNVSDFRGGDDYIFGNEIVASNREVFKEFRQIIGEFMNV